MSSEQLDPVIIIGMHRSGTSMISRMLEALGLFQGLEKDPNNEPFFFLDINDWLLRLSGGAWDYPRPFQLLLEHEKARSDAAAYIQQRLRSPQATSFFGERMVLCCRVDRRMKFFYRMPANIEGPWGWKDPRNTFTLPLWLDIFPKARVIHVCRHGVDVASSLRVRNEKMLRGDLQPSGRKRKGASNPLFQFNQCIVDTLRCSSLDGGLSLWEEYMAEARTQVHTLGDRAIEVRYEDFLADPPTILGKLAEFCGLNPSRETIFQVAGDAKSARSYAFRSRQELDEFADKMSERLATYGY